MQVATVLTVYGIETLKKVPKAYSNAWVATVLTVYGIETFTTHFTSRQLFVATVLTVYGIETFFKFLKFFMLYLPWLQQYLPFTVLKPWDISPYIHP